MKANIFMKFKFQASLTRDLVLIYVINDLIKIFDQLAAKVGDKTSLDFYLSFT